MFGVLRFGGGGGVRGFGPLGCDPKASSEGDDQMRLVLERGRSWYPPLPEAVQIHNAKLYISN